MTRRRIKAGMLLSMVTVLVLGTALAASAEEGDDIPECTGDSVSGALIALDANTGDAVIEQEDGSLCSVTLNSDGASYDHPVLALMTSYFETSLDSVGLDILEDAVEDLTVYVECDDSGSCILDEDEEAPLGRVLSVEDDGSGGYVITVLMNGEILTLSVEDDYLADLWLESLEMVNVEWELNGSGGLAGDTGNVIESLHEDGMGFGVIVKLIGLSQMATEACSDGLTAEDGTDLCSINLDSLVASFESGTGLGQLFKLVGKPSAMGIGQLRNGENGGPPDGACGYQKNHGDGAASCGNAGNSEQGNSENGKPPWAGSGNNGNGKGNGNP